MTLRPIALFLACAAPIGLAAALPVPAVAAPADDLAAVAAHIRQTRTMTADFAQTDRNGRTLSGTLTMKRPGFVRFDYGKSVPMLVVADGKSLNLIDYQVKQVQRYPIGDSPLSALLDPDKNIARYARMVPTGDPNVISVAVKDPRRPEYGTITMIFLRDAGAPGGLQLASWVALDSQNNRTTVRLSNQRYNVPVSDSAFRWTDPRSSARRGPR